MHGTYGSFGFLDMDRQLQAPLFLYDFGIELRQNEPYDFHNQKRGTYSGFLLQYTLEGCGMFETGKKTELLMPGRAFFISFPDASRYYLPENGSWKFFYLHFGGKLAAHFYDRILKTSGKTFGISRNSEAIRGFLEEYQSVKIGRKYRRYESGTFLYEFLSILQRELEIPLPQKENAFVEEAEAWIQSNYRNPANLSEMCQNLGVSLPHLTRQFHSQKGISPMKYLTQLRLEQAILLLLNTTLNVDQIAVECGYANGNYFSKVFRKATGISPAEYRKGHAGRF